MTYSLHDLDDKLLKYLNFENGFFIEAGANDGLSQSNTALYEFEYGWKGLLVEPNPKKCFECKKRRINSIVENYALVSDNYTDDYIEGNFDETGYSESLTSLVYDKGDWCDSHLQIHKEQIKNNLIRVPAITLNKLLEKHNVDRVDFISLDVEGYEISVLNGFDLDKYNPKYFLIETTNLENRKKSIIEYMEERDYTVIDQPSINDSLFAKK
jgi:FkbM family methyltransferase